MTQGEDMQRHRAEGLKGHLATANQRIAEPYVESEKLIDRVAELTEENQRLDGQWLDGGSRPEDIDTGTPVHYHPIRGEPEYRLPSGRVRLRVVCLVVSGPSPELVADRS